MQGTTTSGFRYTIDDRILTDWRFVDAVAKTNSDNKLDRMAGMSEMGKLMLTNMDDLIKHVQSYSDGYAPLEAVSNELIEIMSGVDASKNSDTSQDA